jgi:hypothetical protein
MSKSPHLSSPFNMSTPSSAPMARKRTFQDLDLPASPHTLASSSSPFVGRPNGFDSPHNAFLSSPATVYSSPMGRSVSAQSTFNSFTQTLESPPKKEIKTEQISPPKTRPGMKRRRTIADVSASPASPVPFIDGRNGEDVWPADVEAAFHAGTSFFSLSSSLFFSRSLLQLFVSSLASVARSL